MLHFERAASGGGAAADSSPKMELRAGLVLPGVTPISLGASAVLADSFYYGLIQITQSGTLTELHAEITIASGAGTRLKLLLYDADETGTVGALRQESGHLPCDTLGLKSLTGLAIPVARGQYFALTPWTEATATFRAVRGALYNGATINPLMSGSTLLSTLRVAGLAYGGGAPALGGAPTPTYGTSPLLYTVFPKIV